MNKEKEYWKIKEDKRTELLEQSKMISADALQGFTQNPIPLDNEMCVDFINQAELLKKKIDDYVEAVKQNVVKADVIYLNHPESDTAFVELKENLHSHDGQCDEISLEQHNKIKKEQNET